MQRSKHLAVMFLLGAVLVGGALGFTADRVLLGERLCPRWGSHGSMRARFAEELELTAAQRAAMDTILDVRHRQMSEVLKPVRPQMDSISENARNQIRRLLTPAQQPKFDDMHREMREKQQNTERS
jgi:Spy/CpxP family protein refolding chaperone